MMEGPPWSLDDKKVCFNCFEDNGIRAYIKNRSDGNSCNFCNASQTKSLTFSILMDFISNRISEKYTDPLNAGVPYEGGFIFEGQSIEDLLEELDLGINTDTVWERITNYLGNDNWIRNDWNMPDDPRFNDEMFNWEHFCEFVKEKRRFFFKKTQSSRIIGVLKELIQEKNLIKELKPGTVFYRARSFKQTDPVLEYSIKNLGPPKSQDIMDKSSRMSPAGIPMFYCSENEVTAIKEISVLEEEGYALIGKFKLKKKMYIVDFSTADRVRIPSYFDEKTSLKKRDRMTFLKQFPEEISKPIEKDGREHTEYVPTQIITEFLKDLRVGNKRIRGVGYKSAIGLGKSYALFFRRGYDNDLLPSSFLCLDADFKLKVKMPYF